MYSLYLSLSLSRYIYIIWYEVVNINMFKLASYVDGYRSHFEIPDIGREMCLVSISMQSPSKLNARKSTDLPVVQNPLPFNNSWGQKSYIGCVVQSMRCCKIVLEGNAAFGHWFAYRYCINSFLHMSMIVKALQVLDGWSGCYWLKSHQIWMNMMSNKRHMVTIYAKDWYLSSVP